MNAILAITALIAAVTAREIVLVIAAHVKAKDALKALETVKETAEERRRGAECQAAEAKSKENAWKYRKEASDAEIREAEIKSALADKIAAMTAEQLEAYNKTLQPTVNYVPVTQYVPVPYWTPFNPQQSIMQWRRF